MLSDNIQRVGIGLRQPHYSNWLSRDTGGLWCEAISENYMFSEGKPLTTLEKIRETKPVAFHGVSMSVGSAHVNRDAYLKSLKTLADRIQPWIVSDHFCWTRTAQHNSFDLLPIPFTTEAVGIIVDSIDQIQSVLRRRMYFENVSAYVGFRSSQLTEIEFINEVISRSGCGLLLDVNNVFVNAHNFGFDPFSYIDRVIPESVGEIHLAGHSVVDDFLFDTHDQPVGKEVWDLYRYTLSHVGNVPTLIEWDEAIPDFDVLNTQRLEAEYHLQGVFNAPRVATEIND